MRDRVCAVHGVSHLRHEFFEKRLSSCACPLIELDLRRVFAAVLKVALRSLDLRLTLRVEAATDVVIALMLEGLILIDGLLLLLEVHVEFPARSLALRTSLMLLRGSEDL